MANGPPARSPVLSGPGRPRAGAPEDQLIRLGRLFFYAGSALVPLLAIRWSTLAISDILYFLAAILAVLSMLRHHPKPRPTLWAAATFTTIVAIGVSGHAHNSSESYTVALRIIYIITIWQWTGRTLLRRPRHVTTAISCYVLGSVGTALWALLQAMGIAPTASSGLGRSEGLSLHPNALGGILALAIILGLNNMIQGHNPRIFAPAVGVAVVGITASGSVSGMLSAFVGSAAVIAVTRQPKRIVALLIAVPLLIGAVAVFQDAAQFSVSPMERLSQTRGLGVGPSTIETRLDTIRVAWEHIRLSPFVGVGLDDASGGTDRESTLVHNMIFRIWYQGGVVLLIAIVIALASMSRGAAWGKPRLQSPSATGIRGAMLGALVFGMTGPALFERWFWLPFLLGSALVEISAMESAQSDIRSRGDDES